MTVADHVLAVLGGMASIAIILLGFLWVFASGMASTPSEESQRTGRQGCAGAVFGVIALIYFAGVIWSGEWRWLQ